MTHLRVVLTFAVLLFLTACSTVEVRTTDLKPASRIEVDTPEDLLLDIGLQIFEPELEDIPDDRVIFTSVRESESVWAAQQLKRTLDETNAWGVVRIVPDDEVIMDLMVSGKILQSDGETLTIDVKATDTSSKVWLDKEYSTVVSRYSYDPSQADREPFQALYNDIANDLLAILLATPLEQREDIRTLSTIRFAQSFSPEAFNEFLVQDEEGHYQIDRLPAENDPALARIAEIQVRDQLFVDVLQDYYVGFTDQMEEPYREWRAQSYRETRAIRDLQKSARNQRLAGWLAIIGGAASLFYDDGSSAATENIVRAAGSVAIFGGLQAVTGSFQKRDEAALHIQTLSEIGLSIESELEPSIIELQDRTVTLTGTVRDQYDDWRKILREIYQQETGYQLPPADSLTNVSAETAQ